MGTVYFMIAEENIRKQIALPWVSFGSDAASMAPELPFTKSSTHPRAYGNFARLLGKYVRDGKVIPLEEAVHRLSGLPATNLELQGRGFIREGLFADVVVFDPATIADRATFEQPHQYAVGMRHVFVNGTQVLKDGEHTGASRVGAARGRDGDSDRRRQGIRRLLDHARHLVAGRAGTTRCRHFISTGTHRGSVTTWACRSSAIGALRYWPFQRAMATSGSSIDTASSTPSVSSSRGAA